MARLFRALCLRDTVQDVPYLFYKAGREYIIPEDCVVRQHFRPLGELSKKEADRVIGEAAEKA